MTRLGLSSLVRTLAVVVVLGAAGLTWAPAASAQAPPGQTSGEPPQAGRRLGRSDWVSRVPIAVGAVLLVVLIDGIFIARIRTNRDASARGRRPGRPSA